MRYFGSGTADGDIPTSGMYPTALGPDQLPVTTPDGPIYGPSYEPAQDFLLQYKWYLVAGAGALFLLAGGSILGLSLRKKRRRGRR